MKKNASCKSIRTNITSPTAAYRPLTKKSHLDILSCKNQHAPSNTPLTIEIEMPSSLKSQAEYGLRKKVFSNAKLAMNN